MRDRRGRASLVLRRSAGSLVAGVALALVTAAPAAACPECAEGRAARSDVYAGDFMRHLATLLVPFLFVGAVCARVERVGRSSRAAPPPAQCAVASERRASSESSSSQLRQT